MRRLLLFLSAVAAPWLHAPPAASEARASQATARLRAAPSTPRGRLCPWPGSLSAAAQVLRCGESSRIRTPGPGQRLKQAGHMRPPAPGGACQGGPGHARRQHLKRATAHARSPGAASAPGGANCAATAAMACCTRGPPALRRHAPRGREMPYNRGVVECEISRAPLGRL